MLQLIAPVREQDEHGAGHWDASRGDRLHHAVDYAAQPGSKVLAMRAGIVTKLGYPYTGDMKTRYVEITDVRKLRWRYFYVEPTVELGDNIPRGREIGIVQSLAERYPGITEHVHVEVLDEDDDRYHPEKWA